MTALLTLTATAFLAQLADQTIILRFEGMQYASNQVVPFHIVRSKIRHTRQTAAEYVVRCMTEKHGAKRGDWPQLAQQFVPDPGRA